MAIVNATLPIGDQIVAVPISVTPVGEGPQGFAVAQTPSPTGGFDLTAVTAMITAVGGVLGTIGFKAFRDGKRDDTRANIMADTQLKQVESLQETDKADYIFRSAIAEYIKNPADEAAKQKIINLSQQSHEEYSAYYENIKPTPSDYSKDKVVQKLSAVQKRTTSTK